MSNNSLQNEASQILFLIPMRGNEANVHDEDDDEEKNS